MLHLVSSSVLALDLVQHPAGLEVAAAVDRVLLLDPAEVDRLAGLAGPAAARALDRHLVLSAAAALPRLDALVGGVQAALAALAPGPGEARIMLAALGDVLVHRLEDVLDGLAREGPLGDPRLPADGVQAALDGVAATWLPAGAPPEALAAAVRLGAAWRAAAPPVPTPLPLPAYAGGGPALLDLLDRAAHLDPAGWRRVVAARAATRRGLTWSTALHRACQAAADADRVLPVARAQLAATRTLRLAGISATTDARAAAMAVTAAVQATCLPDLLDARTARTLLAPWSAALTA